MSLVRYEPLNLLDRFNRDFHRLRLFEPFVNEASDEGNSNVIVSHWRSAVDIKEKDKQFLIKADIPGVDPKDIEITMNDNVLTIKGERSAEKEDVSEVYKRIVA